jgi:U3 small nucleolar RNA-associated protein 4
VLLCLEVITILCLSRSILTFPGPDASPTVVPLGQYGFENQRSLPFLSQESILRSAPEKRLMMSWWDREVHIWRLSTSSKPPTSEDSEEESPTQSRKLVAKILLKGEANITSADLSADGNILAVSTTTETKLFLLRPRSSSDENDTLRISKLSVPSTFSFGARQLQFSPDGRWLCSILPNSHITLARILTSTSSPLNITIHPQLTRLTRLERHIEKYITLGGLGNYDRTITQIAFSADSRILAVSDLAGYIDTFILSGAEDITLPLPDIDDASLSDSDSEDEDDEEEEKPKEKKLILGQHWTRDPSASSLPKLPSTPVVLSFRPATAKLKALTNGTTAPVPHPTRKTPNPIPRDIPGGEDRLLVVTATSDLFEFSVLKGGLSDWSRRNPTSSFPEKFRKTLETVKGCIWDISEDKERVWLYSVNSLWMFDLARDFPPEETQQNGNVEGGDGNAVVSKKRKRKHGKAGAGGEIPERKKNNMGISRTVEKIVHEEVAEVQRLFPDEIEDNEEYETALERLQRVESSGGGDGGEEKPHHWQTFKYRPIMGIVLLGDGKGEGSVGPEVAVVERPIWEVELPPRYYGDQEWRDREVDVV